MSKKKERVIPFPEHHRYVRERVRTFRKKRGLRQGDMASRMGISRGSYNEMENLPRDMRLSSLFRLAEALEIPVYTLLVGVDDIAAQLINAPFVGTKTKYREKKYRERMRARLVEQFGEDAVAQAEKDIAR